MNRIVRVIIAGGRDFNNLELMIEKCDYYLSDAVKKGYTIEIVSGTAKGADKLGEEYAKLRGYRIAYFPADWASYGKRGGYLRNQQMANYAGTDGALILFWDGQSKGSKHMLDIAKSKKMHVRVVKYNK